MCERARGAGGHWAALLPLSLGKGSLAPLQVLGSRAAVRGCWGNPALSRQSWAGFLPARARSSSVLHTGLKHILLDALAWRNSLEPDPCWSPVPSPEGLSCPHCLLRLCFKIILSLRHQLIYFNSISNLCLISFHIQVSHLALMNCNCF